MRATEVYFADTWVNSEVRCARRSAGRRGRVRLAEFEENDLRRNAHPDGDAAHPEAARDDHVAAVLDDVAVGIVVPAHLADGGRVAEAAARIGIGRATQYKKIEALGIAI